MSFSPNADYFELFGLTPGFEIDQELLSLRFRELQRSAHPDRFANASAQDKLASVQQAALINEAYQALKSPLGRGRYLLARSGAQLDDADTRMDTGFLMEQMTLREDLAAVPTSADPFTTLDLLRQRIESKEREMVAQLQRLDEAVLAGDPEALEQGVQWVRKMQFMRRLLEELDSMEDELVHQG